MKSPSSNKSRTIFLSALKGEINAVRTTIPESTNPEVEILTETEIKEIESEIGNQVDIDEATKVVATELLKYIVI